MMTADTATATATATAAAQVAMDRFVSASSGQDAIASLQSLLEGLNDGGKKNANRDEPAVAAAAAASSSWPTAWIWQHEEVAECLVLVLQEQRLKANPEDHMTLSNDDAEEAVTLVLQIYQQHLAKDRQSLIQPAPSALLEALLDVMDRRSSSSGNSITNPSSSSSSSSTTYTRVLALQVLQQLGQAHTSVANSQWLQAPNGLHRLAETLTNDWDNPLEEAVRTQALPVAMHLARTSPPVAKVFVFAEVESQLLDTTWHVYGGLTKGNPMVYDVLQFIYTLIEHGVAGDASLLELVWQRPAVAPRLAQLLDLRGGDEFLHPEDHVDKKKKQSKKKKETNAKTSTTNKKKKKHKPKLGPLSSRNMDDHDHDDDDEEDDLAALLQSGTGGNKTTKTKKASGASDSGGDGTITNSAPSQKQQTELQPSQDYYPCLLETEEKIVSTVLKIVHSLLAGGGGGGDGVDGDDSNSNATALQRKVWSDYAPGMCSLIWELALQTPPPPGVPPFLAFPSCHLQQQALELIATKLADPMTMDRHNGLDRLLEKVCTGGGLAVPWSLPEKLGISQAALAVLRSVLDADRIHSILIHTLAPPPMMMEEDDELLRNADGTPAPPSSPPAGPTVVEKLWNTVAENLIVVVASPTKEDGGDANPAQDPISPATATVNDEQRTLFLSGALGGLAVFLIDEESREMLFRATPPAAHLDHMLEVLVEQQHDGSGTGTGTGTGNADSNSNSNNEVVVWSLYRFLCEYIYETPRIVQTLLSNPASTHLATLATTKSTISIASSTSSPFSTKPLVYLLLGLCMEFFPTDVAECGGWTPASILDLLQTIGISKVTKAMEGFKKIKTGSGASAGAIQTQHIPWTGCELEAQHWSHWYQKAVWIVRKRVVREMAGNSSFEDDDDDDEVEDSSSQQVAHGRGPATPGTPAAGASGTFATPASSSISNAKLRPLQRLISQQTSELEELRQQLEAANIKMARQDHQLETWQRRLKSTPTELDGMLNELTTQTATLEEQITSLKKERQRDQETHQEAMAAMTKHLDEQREEANKLRAAEQEAQDDRDRMEQELQALSQAYSSLEDEYRRASSSTSSVAATPSTEGGAPTGEAAGASHQDQQHQYQSQGEASTPGGSTEVSTLRAENARLRQDARAADEWMAMAVQRMNDMGGQMTQLQQENASLKEYSQSASTSVEASQQVQSMRHEIEHLHQQVSSLQDQVRQEQSQVTSLREHLQLVEAQKAAEIQAAVAAAQEEASRNVVVESDPHQAAEIEHLHNELEAKRSENEALQTSLQVARSSSTSGVAASAAEMERLHNELAAKSSEIHSLQTALEETRRLASSTTVSESPISAQTPVGSDEEMAKQLQAARQEMEESRRRAELEIYKKESIIRELEDRIGSGLGPYKVEDIRERDHEIEELRDANEAAQEWMSKAVEHHQLLQEKVATLTEEKAELMASAQRGQSFQLPPSTAHEAAVKLLEARASELESEKTALEEQISAMQATIESYESSKEEARDEIETLTQSLEETRTEFSVYRDESEAKVGKWTERVLALENQLSDRGAELQELQQDLEHALARTAEFESWTELAQSKIAELLSSKEQADKLVRAKDAEISALVSNLEAAHDSSTRSLPAVDPTADQSAITQLESEKADALAAKEQVETELKELENAMEQLKCEVADDAAAKDQLESEVKEQQNVIEELKSEKMDAVAAKEQLEIELKELRLKLEFTGGNGQLDTATAAQTMFNEAPPTDAADFFGGSSIEGGASSTVAMATIEDDTDQAAENLRLKEELRVANETIESDQDVVRQWEDRVAELEATIQSLTAQIKEEQEEANRVIAQWQESCDAADEKCKELESKLEEKDRSGQDPTALPKTEGRSKPDEEGSDQAETIRRLEEELMVANETIESDQDVVRQWEDRVAELESTIQSLTTQIEDEQEEANRVIAQWQESCDAADEKCKELEAKLDDESKNRTWEASEPSEIQSMLQAKEGELRVANEALAEAEDVVKQWEERSNELEGELSSLKAQIDENRVLADDTQAILQEKIDSLEKRCRELEEVDPPPTGAQQNGDVASKTSNSEERISQLEDEKAAIEELLQETRTEFSEFRSESEALVSQWTERVEELENQVTQLGAQLGQQEANANAAIAGWEAKTEELKNEIRAAQDVARQWTERAEELEGEVKSLREQLADRADNLQESLQEKLDSLEKRCYHLEEDCNELRNEKMDADQHAQDLASKASILEERVGQLEEEKAALEAKISSVAKSDEAEQLEEELAVERGRHHEAREEVESLTKSLEETRAEFSDFREESETVVGQWTDRVEELENQVSELGAQLGQQEAEANEAIASWENKAQELENEVQAAEEALERWNKRAEELEDEVQSLSGQLEESRGGSEKIHRVLQEQVEKLQGRCQQLAEDYNNSQNDKMEADRYAEDLLDKISILEERGNQLENEKATLRAEISAQRKSHEAERLEEELAVERGQHHEAREELDSLTKSLEEMRAEFSEFRNESETVVEQWTERVDELEHQISELETQLSEQEAEANEAIARWEVKAEEMEEEAQTVKERLAEAKDDLRHSNEGLKAANERLAETEGAVTRWEERAEELESEVRSLHAQLDEGREDVRRWKDRSEELEGEVNSLSAQIEENRGGGLHEKADAELRKSLLRSLEELEDARAAEKEANEKLAKLRLQTAVGEQEIVAAKSEINFLTDAMEELRMNEESKRASLEYRIGSLEDENDVLRRYHSSELETIRNEFAQASMEKDRILHQLKESEKTNSALVFAASKAERHQGMEHSLDTPAATSTSMQDLDAEICKLRIENAYLLTVAADDKARAERRLREALAAHRASIETDNILEHELRLAAESTIQSLKTQLDEYRTSRVR